MEVIYPGSTIDIDSIISMSQTEVHKSMATDEMELYRASLRKEAARKRASTIGVPQTRLTPTQTEDSNTYATPSSLPSSHFTRKSSPRSLLKGNWH